MGKKSNKSLRGDMPKVYGDSKEIMNLRKDLGLVEDREEQKNKRQGRRNRRNFY